MLWSERESREGREQRSPDQKHTGLALHTQGLGYEPNMHLVTDGEAAERWAWHSHAVHAGRGLPPMLGVRLGL